MDGICVLYHHVVANLINMDLFEELAIHSAPNAPVLWNLCGSFFYLTAPIPAEASAERVISNLDDTRNS